MSDVVRRFVVDRREGKFLVIEDDAGAMQDVPIRELPSDCRAEGAVIDVPMIGDAPHWEKAHRNRAEERKRLKELGGRMDRLRTDETDGDIEL